MSKAVVVIAAVALIFVVGAPPVIGALTELGLRRHAETIETIPETPYRLDVVDYEGGWFGSTARVEARLTDAYLDQVIAAATQGEDETAAAVARLTMQVFLGQSLPLEVEIGHGPVFIDGGVRVGIVSTVIRPDPATAGMPELLQSLGMPYLFEARTVTAMNGDTRFVVGRQLSADE